MPRHINTRRWRRIRAAIIARDGYQCVQCGRSGLLEVDHIIPRHKGGAIYDPANLQSLCSGPYGCHARKTAAELGNTDARQRRHRWTAVLDAIRSR